MILKFSSQILTMFSQYNLKAGLLVVGMVLFGISSPVAAKVVEMDSFKDWSVYRDDSGSSRVCYMSSVPKKLRGDYDRNNRGETRVCKPFWQC